MEKDFFVLLLQAVLIIALFFVIRMMIRGKAVKAKNQEEDIHVLHVHIANQTLGAFVCAGFILSFLLCAILAWWQILSSVLIAAVVVALILLFSKKKSNP